MTTNEIAKWIPRERINQKLDEIRARIGQEDSELLQKELDEIFTYKPVDNYYVLVRGELYLQEQEFDKLSNILLNKDFWIIPGPYALSLAELEYKFGIATQMQDNSARVMVFSYYVYLASIADKTNDQNRKCNQAFIEKAQQIYEEECTLLQISREELLSIDLQINKETNHQILDYLFHRHYNLREDMLALLSIAVREKLYITGDEEYRLERFLEELETRQPNVGYIAKELFEHDSNKVLLITGKEGNLEQYQELCKYLTFLGKQCILIDQPVSVELDYLVDLKDTVMISLENQEVTKDCTIIHPVELFFLEEFIGNNTVKMVEALLEGEDSNFFDLITSEKIFRQMKQSKELEKKVQVLTEYSGTVLEQFIGFGYVGNYTTYISHIYGFNYQSSLLEENHYQCSVILPAKNSAYTLQYTLQTCLEQRGNINYEIIVSDNSDEGNLEVKNLITELNQPRIQYVRTPVNLPLAKSFEFAYGKARGEYIISLGSDDGLLPWALETLMNMKEKYPRNNIIGWERGFFQWTESQDPQRGKLTIPRYYQKGEWNDVEYNAPLSLKEQMDSDAKFIFEMPLLYINSAFKRSYLKELYEKTGTILDGYTQDISMGIKALLLNDRFTFLKYPLTIAAISDASLGGQMSLASQNDISMKNKIYNERKQGFGKPIIESTSPVYALGTTEGMFWGEIFKMRNLPACRERLNELLAKHNWTQTIETVFHKLNILDVSYMKSLEVLRYNAYQINAQAGEWFDCNLYHKITGMVCKVELEPKAGMAFETGFIKEGLTLDANKFAVHTVAEAVALFANITNL